MNDSPVVVYRSHRLGKSLESRHRLLRESDREARRSGQQINEHTYLHLHSQRSLEKDCRRMFLATIRKSCRARWLHPACAGSGAWINEL